MQSKAKTVKEYLDSLPPDRRDALLAVRKMILAHLPQGFEETMQYGMIGYVVPLSIYPKGYLDKKDVPLPYIALASQKNYMAVYLMGIYTDSEALKKLQNQYKKEGKKLDMGKSCIRFKKLSDVSLVALEEVVKLFSISDWINLYEQGKK